MDKKYPQFGDAPFCGHKPECNNGEGCEWCREFALWVEGIDLFH